MKQISIAFDVDGTLISTEQDKDGMPIVNERIRNLLIALSSFKNVKIFVWSGSGAGYAQHIARQINITKYVTAYADKNHQGVDINGKHIFLPDMKPDIAIDDIQDCELGIFNLIVREK
jgi:hydroxymethylpyrimidine pyrophosphatase-like HAD family hydrolase